MSFQPSSLLELSARVAAVSGVPFSEEDLPRTLQEYLGSSHRCVNPSCKGVYFNTRVGWDTLIVIFRQMETRGREHILYFPIRAFS